MGEEGSPCCPPPERVLPQAVVITGGLMKKREECSKAQLSNKEELSVNASAQPMIGQQIKVIVDTPSSEMTCEPMYRTEPGVTPSVNTLRPTILPYSCGPTIVPHMRLWGEGRCWKCHKFNHKTKDCKAPRRWAFCYLCGAPNCKVSSCQQCALWWFKCQSRPLACVPRIPRGNVFFITVVVSGIKAV